MKTTINKYFSVLLISFCLIFVISCDKEVNEALISNTQDPISVLYNLEVNDDGIIVFENLDEFTKALTQLANLSEHERLTWETQIGLTSLQSKINDLYSEIDKIDNTEELYEFVKTNYKYIELDATNIEDVSVNSIYPLTIYPYFCSKDGAYIIGDSIYRVGQKNVVSTHISNKLELINTPIDRIDSDFVFENASSFKYINSSLTGAKTNSSYTAMVETSNPNRRCWINVECYYVQYGAGYAVVVTSTVWGQKKVGAWFNYKTVLARKNHSFDLAYVKNISGTYSTLTNRTMPDYYSSPTEVNSIVGTVYIDTNCGLNEHVYFTRAYAQGYSRGVAQWIAIDN